MKKTLFPLAFILLAASLACRTLFPDGPVSSGTAVPFVATEVIVYPTAPALATETLLTVEIPTPTPQPTIPPTIPPPVIPPLTRAELARALDQLDTYPCPDSDFTCVRLEAPLDHRHPEDGGTLEVIFGILPASGERKGMFVTATGGPGSSGLASADAYSWSMDPEILAHFDLVFFDQRGIGASGGLTCENATSTFNQIELSALTPADEQELADAAEQFVQSCLAEMGASGWLPFLGTDQAVEDLEAFRIALLGQEGGTAEKIWLYGESYGTQFAQVYAHAHPGALEGLILDGVVDLTISGLEYLDEQSQAMQTVLEMTLAACEADPYCRDDFNLTAGNDRQPSNVMAAYEQVASRLEDSPVPVAFPLPQGGTAPRAFSQTDLEMVVAGQVYSESDRMLLLRGLAAASNDDWVPLLRLLYQNLSVDPITLVPMPDPSFSDAMYYAVECRDYEFGELPSGSPAEQAEAYLDAGDAIDESPDHLDSVFYSDLPCVFWPDGEGGGLSSQMPPLAAEGIPTLVLIATADPATPPGNGERVFSSLADGYLVTTIGGPHVTYGWGNSCPDDLVTRFLVDGQPPSPRESTCEGVVIEEYVPWPPDSASGFTDALDAMYWTDLEIYYLPEYYYWDLVTPTSVGCPHGGSISFDPTFDGEKLTLSACSFTRGFILTGTGHYTDETGQLTLDVEISGQVTGSLHYVYQSDGSISVRGTYNGEQVRLSE